MIGTCEYCNRNNVALMTLVVDGADGMPEELEVCQHCADALDPVEWLPAVLNPGGGPIPA